MHKQTLKHRYDGASCEYLSFVRENKLVTVCILININFSTIF